MSGRRMRREDGLLVRVWCLCEQSVAHSGSSRPTALLTCLEAACSASTIGSSQCGAGVEVFHGRHMEVFTARWLLGVEPVLEQALLFPRHGSDVYARRSACRGGGLRPHAGVDSPFRFLRLFSPLRPEAHFRYLFAIACSNET